MLGNEMILSLTVSRWIVDLAGQFDERNKKKVIFDQLP